MIYVSLGLVNSMNYVMRSNAYLESIRIG